MLKIGIVGTGGMGTVHYSNYQHIDKVKVVAFVGKSEKSKEKGRQLDLPVYESIDLMCKNEDIDIVDICTPTYLHYDHVKSALNNSKHVICEKPLTLSLDKAKDLYDLAKTKQRHLYVAQVVQFTKSSDVLREIVSDNRFGKPLDAVFERLSAKPNWSNDSWMFDKSKAGLIPYDLHIHDLDLITSLFGKPKNIKVQKSQGILNFPEHYRFLYEYKDLNVVGEAAWFNAQIPFTARWRVYFEKALLVFDGSSLIAYLSDDDPVEFDISEKEKIETGINVPPTEMYLIQLRHFVDCVRKNIASPIVTKAQVLETLSILEAITDLN